MFGDMTIIAWLMGGIALAYGWVGIAAKAEGHFNDVTKVRIRRWFAPSADDTEARPGWADSFIDLFDATFGDRFFSWRFFLRSCLATTLIFAAIILIYIGYGWITQASLQELYGKTVRISGATLWTVWQWLILIFLGNLLADYLSLMGTRLVLGWILGCGVTRRILGVLADIALTFVIYFGVASALYAIENLWQNDIALSRQLNYVLGSEIYGGANSWTARNTTLFAVFQLVFWDTDGWAGSRLDFGHLYADLYRISFITTFFTSVWIWLFLLTGVIGRLAFAGHGALRRFGRLFDVKKHPVVTIGWFLAAVTLLLHITIFAGVNIWRATAAEPAPPAAEQTEG
jgi:hypothetical protein